MKLFDKRANDCIKLINGNFKYTLHQFINKNCQLTVYISDDFIINLHDAGNQTFSFFNDKKTGDCRNISYTNFKRFIKERSNQ